MWKSVLHNVNVIIKFLAAPTVLFQPYSFNQSNWTIRKDKDSAITASIIWLKVLARVDKYLKEMEQYILIRLIKYLCYNKKLRKLKLQKSKQNKAIGISLMLNRIQKKIKIMNHQMKMNSRKPMTQNSQDKATKIKKHTRCMLNR